MAGSREVGERRPVRLGLDVSENGMQLCVVAADGGRPFEATVAAEPDTLVRAIAKTVGRPEARIELLGL